MSSGHIVIFKNNMTNVISQNYILKGIDVIFKNYKA